MELEPMEERVVELLGQIKASVGETVRALNEASARHRREADEAHRQHDEAQAKLAAVKSAAEGLLERNKQVVAEICEGWRSQIGRVTVEVASAQARQHANAAVSAIEGRAKDLISQLQRQVEQVAEVNQSLKWKTMGYAGLLAVALCLVVLPLCLSWGARAMSTEAEELVRAQSSGAARLLTLKDAEFRACEIGGKSRLCVRIDSGLSVPGSKPGEAFAVVQGY